MKQCGSFTYFQAKARRWEERCQHQPSLLCEAISPGHEREIRFDSSLAVHLHSPLNLTRRDDACRSRPAVRPLTRRTLLRPAVYHRNCLGIQKKN
jgi:hypothetical protein